MDTKSNSIYGFVHLCLAGVRDLHRSILMTAIALWILVALATGVDNSFAQTEVPTNGVDCKFSIT